MYLLHVHTYTTKYTSDTFRMIACVEQKKWEWERDIKDNVLVNYYENKRGQCIDTN